MKNKQITNVVMFIFITMKFNDLLRVKKKPRYDFFLMEMVSRGR